MFVSLYGGTSLVFFVLAGGDSVVNLRFRACWSLVLSVWSVGLVSVAVLSLDLGSLGACWSSLGLGSVTLFLLCFSWVGVWVVLVYFGCCR